MTTEPDERRRLAGRYRVDGSLGRGGMSEVFHGYDERLDRQVAIKVLRPPSAPVPVGPDSPESVEILDALERDRKRFLREIRTTARLELAGAPAVYDTGVDTAADGTAQLWLVMQLLRGSTLEAVLDRADYSGDPPSVGWAVAIAAQIAAVLVDVHRVDVVHRDIKPANVMIVDGGLVKVLDFGIAILRGTGALPRLTQVDRTIGTPPYMSPEQCLGQVVTAASDVYSLGCVLCELLTGDPPFHQTADRSLRAQHLYTPLPSLREKRPDVPAGVDDLVTAMLAKESDDRPSAEAVYAGLMPLASGEGPTGTEDARDPTRPFRSPLLSPPRRRSEPVDHTPISDAEVGQLQVDVAALLQDDRYTEAIRLLEGGVTRAGSDLAVQMRLRQRLAEALYDAGEFTRAGPLFDVVGRDLGRYLGGTDPLVLECSAYAGLAYAELGQPHKALPHLLFVLHHADADDATMLDVRFALAQMFAGDGRRDEAITELRALRPLLAEVFGADSTHVRNLDKHLDRLNDQPA